MKNKIFHVARRGFQFNKLTGVYAYYSILRGRFTSVNLIAKKLKTISRGQKPFGLKS